MKRLFGKFIKSMILSIQFLGLMILGLIFIISPDLAVDLGMNYYKFRTALS